MAKTIISISWLFIVEYVKLAYFPAVVNKVLRIVVGCPMCVHGS